MIQDFSLDNFLSFGSRQEITFEASSDKTSEASPVITIRHPKSGVVIGEGPTEQYYLMSIQGMIPVNVYPKVVKDGMEYLTARVEECIAEGYDKVYCLIDMDNKSGKKEKEAYNVFLSRDDGKRFRNHED